MGIVDTVRTIKKIQIKDVIMIIIGKFIYSYGKDAYIMSYIFGYKLKLIEDNIYVCAFPRSSLNKVMATLENKKINYIVLDRRNNYREDEKFNSGNLNKYDDYIKKAIKYVRRKNQIDGICEFLKNNIEKDEFEETIIEIKKIINERRKI